MLGETWNWRCWFPSMASAVSLGSTWPIIFLVLLDMVLISGVKKVNSEGR